MSAPASTTFIIVSWSQESSYETPSVSQPYGSLDEIIAEYAPYEDEPIMDGGSSGISYSKIMQSADGGSYRELYDSEATDFQRRIDAERKRIAGEKSGIIDPDQHADSLRSQLAEPRS